MAKVGKATIRKVSEAERRERMKILTTAERRAAPTKEERRRKAAEAKAAIEQRELEKKIEEARAKGIEFERKLGMLEPTRGPVAPTGSIFQAPRPGTAILQATANKYQQRALSSILQKAQQQGFTRAQDVQISGLSQAAYQATQTFAKTVRKGAPILQEKIAVVSPTTGKVIRYPIESVVRGAEMAGMLPGGIEVMARRPEVIVPAVAVGVAQVAAMPAVIREEPKQFISDIVTLGLLFKAPTAAKAAVKFKPTVPAVPKVKIPELKPTALQKQYLELAAIWEAPKVKAPIVKPVPKPIPKNVIIKKTTSIKKMDTTVTTKAKDIAKQTIQKEKKVTPTEKKVYTGRIKKLRDDAFAQLQKKWKQEDALYKQIEAEIKKYEAKNQKVPQWLKDTYFELKVSRKTQRTKAQANAEITKKVNDILFKEQRAIEAMVKKGATKVERQKFIKKIKHKIEVEKKKKIPSPTQIKLWERQIELARTRKSLTIDEIITQTKAKRRVRGLKELLAEERAEARLVIELRPPTTKQITATFRTVKADIVSKTLQKQYLNVPAFKSAKYQRMVTGKWNPTIDKWNRRFVPQMVSSKSLTKAQSKTLSKSIITAMLKHKATTVIGIIRLLPATTVSIYQSLTTMQMQTVQAMILEMLDTQARTILDLTKAPPMPKEKIPPKPRVIRKKPLVKIPPKPEKAKPPRKPVAAKEEPPLKIPIIPKLRAVEKKKVVRVRRRVVKEYTQFQIVNQIGGIHQLFG